MYGSHDIQFIHPYLWKIPRLATDKWPDPRTYIEIGDLASGRGQLPDLRQRLLQPGGHEVEGPRDQRPHRRLGECGGGAGQVHLAADCGLQTLRRRQIGAYQDITPANSWSGASRPRRSTASTAAISRAPSVSPTATPISTAGNQGHFFEVTPSGEVVWEYLYPGIPGTAAFAMGGGFNTDNKDAANNAQCYRSYRYGTDFPGLAGKDLTRKGTLSGRVPRLVGSSDTVSRP